VQLDTRDLLVALKRAKVIDGRTMVALLSRYLNKTRGEAARSSDAQCGQSVHLALQEKGLAELLAP